MSALLYRARLATLTAAARRAGERPAARFVADPPGRTAPPPASPSAGRRRSRPDGPGRWRRLSDRAPAVCIWSGPGSGRPGRAGPAPARRGFAARMRPLVLGLYVWALCCLLLGCASSAVPDDALRLPPESLERRALQTRRFDGTAETEILAAAAGVLQDLGFVIEESETRLGLIVASKQRSAKNAAQIATATLIELLLGRHMPTDDKQTIRASLVTRRVSGPAGEGSFLVRVTFQRLVWDNAHQVSRSEPLAEPELYQGFFERLSKSVFLEAHKI